MPSKKDERLLYPREICDEYHEICKALNWNEQTLGYFFKAKLIHGEYNSSKNKALIRVSSFLKLVDFVIEEMDDTVRHVRHLRDENGNLK